MNSLNLSNKDLILQSNFTQLSLIIFYPTHSLNVDAAAGFYSSNIFFSFSSSFSSSTSSSSIFFHCTLQHSAEYSHFTLLINILLLGAIGWLSGKKRMKREKIE